MKCAYCDGLGSLDGPQGIRIKCEDCRGTGYMGGRAPARAVKMPKPPESPLGRLTAREFMFLGLCLWVAAYHLAADVRSLFRSEGIFPSPMAFYVLFWAAVGAATKLFAIHKDRRTRRQGLAFIFFALMMKFAAPAFLEHRERQILHEVKEDQSEAPAGADEGSPAP